jgi:hypothetical protein
MTHSLEMLVKYQSSEEKHNVDGGYSILAQAPLADTIDSVGDDADWLVVGGGDRSHPVLPHRSGPRCRLD